ncbi:FecR family protein [Chitinophaga sp. sic0106]|uniref:FecR family protein n=1 Tax=Chitinophaga sp. sic0106 TaxID=2854785 RepID=UPI001C487D24|nr:FecR family protein [Chitinophaga sp. sic0106]MBV7533023.1 FecR domain-containing protein [Chitinophaga sp. sic0106]
MTDRLRQLFQQYYNKTISPQGEQELFALMADPALEEEVKALILDSYHSGELDVMPEAASGAVLNVILQISSGEESRPAPKTMYRRLPAVVWTSAASVALLLVAGIYFWLRPSKTPPVVAANPKPVMAPSQGTAMLTLADGRQISLDSLQNGLITTDAGADIAFKDGELLYDSKSGQAAPDARNTISTPNGRQFRVVLSDGTQVWLNAASTLRYPAVFPENERSVEITGEAYFEVAANSRAPFRVTVPNQAEVQVLGTHFNVNAYPDIASIKTTLVQGAVRVRATTTNASVVMSPGQQARMTGNSDHIAVEKADVDNVMAWKNGLFNFNGLKLKEVMNELARWYDVEVVYEKNIPDIRFFGELSRSLSLQDMIMALEESKVKVRLEGKRKLVVLP